MTTANEWPPVKGGYQPTQPGTGGRNPPRGDAVTTDAELTVSERESYASTIAALERELALVRAERDVMEAQAEEWCKRAAEHEASDAESLAMYRRARDRAEDEGRRASEAESRLTLTEAARQGEQARAERYRGRLARLCRWVTPRVRPGWRGWGVWSRGVKGEKET